MRSARTSPLTDQYYETHGFDPDAGRDPFDQNPDVTPGPSPYDAQGAWPGSDVHYRNQAFENDRFASNQRPFGKRIFRAVARFAVAVLIGVGATLGWQSYSSEAEEMVRSQAPWLGWLIPAPQITSTAPVARSTELADQLGPIALEIAVVRRQIQRLAVDQDQLGAEEREIAQNVAAIQTIDVGRDLSYRVPGGRATAKTR